MSDPTRPIHVEELADVAHHVLAQDKYEASHAASEVAEAIAKYLTTPAEPTPEPGTAGTATVRGVPDVRVMRVGGEDQAGPWFSAYPTGGSSYRRHQDGDVTDFVPDDADRWRRQVLAIEHDRDEARAEVERLRHTNAQLQENLRAAEHRLNTATEPRPAFVLPLEKDIRRAVLDAAPVSSHQVTERVTQAMRALLAEHAVTESRLATVLHDVLWSGKTAQQRSWDEVAAEVHAALTGKAS